MFQGNWFLRNENLPTLTAEEQDLVATALAPAPAGFHDQANMDAAAQTGDKLAALLAKHPRVLERIGDALLKVVVAKRGCAQSVSFLLANGASLDLDNTVYNVLHEAGHGGAADTLEAAFKAGAADATAVSVKKPHTGWPDNVSLMYWAAWGGYPELANVLIAHGVRVHHELAIKGNGERGTTSLHEAVAPGPWGDPKRIAGKLEVARLLLEDGAHYDANAAAGLDDAERLRALIDAAPETALAADPYGMTALHWAARAGALQCLALLLENGAEANARNKARRTALHLAAEGAMSHHGAGPDNPRQEEAIRLLAKYGADLNAQDGKGRTPLHRATYEGRVAAAEALLAAGADPSITNKRGKTAFAIARKEAKHYKARA